MFLAEKFPFPSTLWVFFHELIANPQTQTLVGLQCDTNTFGEVWGKKKNQNQNHSVTQKNIHCFFVVVVVFFCKLQCIFHVCEMVLGSEWTSTGLALVPKLIYGLLVWFNYSAKKKKTAIKNRCFVIMGQTAELNASTAPGIKKLHCHHVSVKTDSDNWPCWNAGLSDCSVLHMLNRCQLTHMDFGRWSLF